MSRYFSLRWPASSRKGQQGKHRSRGRCTTPQQRAAQPTQREPNRRSCNRRFVQAMAEAKEVQTTASQVSPHFRRLCGRGWKGRGRRGQAHCVVCLQPLSCGFSAFAGVLFDGRIRGIDGYLRLSRLLRAIAHDWRGCCGVCACVGCSPSDCTSRVWCLATSAACATRRSTPL